MKGEQGMRGQRLIKYFQANAGKMPIFHTAHYRGNKENFILLKFEDKGTAYNRWRATVLRTKKGPGEYCDGAEDRPSLDEFTIYQYGASGYHIGPRATCTEEYCVQARSQWDEAAHCS